MFTIKRFGGATAAAAFGLLALGAGAPSQAAPLAPNNSPTHSSDVVKVRSGGFGIYIGPSYGYGYRSYGYRSYYDDYDYYPRRGYRTRYYDGGRHHRHNRRWARERFEHPLGRR